MNDYGEIRDLREEMYVVQIHRRYLEENQSDLLDNDRDLLENYHPKKKFH